MLIKFCGLTRQEDVDQAVKLFLQCRREVVVERDVPLQDAAPLGREGLEPQSCAAGVAPPAQKRGDRDRSQCHQSQYKYPGHW